MQHPHVAVVVAVAVTVAAVVVVGTGRRVAGATKPSAFVLRSTL